MRDILQDEKLVRRIEWTNGLLSLFVCGAAVVWFSWRIAGAVLLGAAVMISSFEALKWQLHRAFRSPSRMPSKGVLFFKYYVRFLATIFVVYTVIYYEWVNPVAFLVGLSLVMVSIVIVAFGEFVIMLLKGDR